MINYAERAEKFKYLVKEKPAPGEILTEKKSCFFYVGGNSQCPVCHEKSGEFKPRRPDLFTRSVQKANFR